MIDAQGLQIAHDDEALLYRPRSLFVQEGPDETTRNARQKIP